MTKLSKAQQKVLEEAKKNIDDARNNNFYDWFRKHYSYFEESSEEKINEYLKKNDERNFWKDNYNDHVNGIAHVDCNGRTLYRLEELGLIEIVEDGTNKGLFDHIKVLNY